MKRIIPIISLLLFFVGATFGQNMVSIADATAPDGSDVLVPVSITDLNDVGSMTLNISYDPTVVTFQSIENNVLTGLFEVSDVANVIKIVWQEIPALDLSGIIFDLKFAYINGTSPLEFVGVDNEVTDAAGDAYDPFTFVDGSIGSEDATMKLSTEFGIPGDTLVVDLSATNLRNIGSMGILINYDNTVVEYLGIGDVNLPEFNDGTTNGTINLGMADGNGFNHVLGLLAELEFIVLSGTDSLVFDQANSEVVDIGFNVVPIIYTGSKVGEADDSFILGDVYGVVGTEVSVPFNGLQLEDIGSIGIDITFDSDVLEFVRIANDITGGSFTGGEDTDGVLTLGYADGSGLTLIEGKIADLVFNYSGGMSDLEWDASSAEILDIGFNTVSVTLMNGSVSLSTVAPDSEVMSLDHNAGDLTSTAYNNGAILYDDSGTGVEWKGAAGLYRGAVVYGTTAKGFINGNANNFELTSQFSDLVNVESFFNAGFESDVNFDQVLNAQIADSNATEAYAGLDVMVTTMSDSADGAGVYYKYTFTNNTGAAITDLYAGVFMDYDVGPDVSYLTNSGGVAVNEHLVYAYMPGTTDPYYGMAACNGISGGGTLSSNIDDAQALRAAAYGYLTTIDASQTVGDQRSWIGSKVPDMAVGASDYVIFASVAGDDLIGIRENAQMAVNKMINLGMSNLDLVGVDERGNLIPDQFELAQNYPNPFNPSTTIKYGLPASSQVKITIYNMLGEVIDVLVNRNQTAGYYEVNWNASKLASGMYLYSIKATSGEAGKDFAIVKKMMLLK